MNEDVLNYKKRTKTELIKLFLSLFIFLSPINQNIPAII